MSKNQRQEEKECLKEDTKGGERENKEEGEEKREKRKETLQGLWRRTKFLHKKQQLLKISKKWKRNEGEKEGAEAKEGKAKRQKGKGMA